VAEVLGFHAAFGQDALGGAAFGTAGVEPDGGFGHRLGFPLVGYGTVGTIEPTTNRAGSFLNGRSDRSGQDDDGVAVAIANRASARARSLVACSSSAPRHRVGRASSPRWAPT